MSKATKAAKPIERFAVVPLWWTTSKRAKWPGSTWAVAVFLLAHARNDPASPMHRCAWPAALTIAEALGVSLRTVGRAFDDLLRNEFIFRVTNAGGDGYSARWIVNANTEGPMSFGEVESRTKAVRLSLGIKSATIGAEVGHDQRGSRPQGGSPTENPTHKRTTPLNSPVRERSLVGVAERRKGSAPPPAIDHANDAAATRRATHAARRETQGTGGPPIESESVHPASIEFAAEVEALRRQFAAPSPAGERRQGPEGCTP